jgi:hypothetical protein
VRLDIKIDGDAAKTFRDLAEQRVPKARLEMTRQAMQAALESTMNLNPVRTGRSRAAWAAALAALGGGSSAQAGLSGPTAEGAALGSLAQSQSDDTTEIAATNAVRYVPFLEYGTTKRAAVGMVRRSLAIVRQKVGDWFRLG